MGRQYLYRIISFERFVQMLERDELYFTHPRYWEDPFEQRLRHVRSHAMFAQCWCRKGTSDAMWRIYSPNRLGVRIRTTKENLVAALAATKKIQKFDFSVRSIKYRPESIIEMYSAFIVEALRDEYSYGLAVEPFYYKRLAFSHEAEVRVVVHDLRAKDEAKPKGFSVSVESRELIDSVLFDPRMPKECVGAYTYYLKGKLNFPGAVTQSTLYASPRLIEV